uniref:non-specific serine/threonine protein kinase n=1 Tax=viral metagenome TaxID=1070528 RepID=A0A6C0JTI4_9ZZZZ
MQGRTIGEGAYGTVSKSYVAMKTLVSEVSFVREATCLWRLRGCEGVVTILKTDLSDLTIKMELYEKDLRSFIPEASKHQKEEIVKQLCRIVAGIHCCKIVHGDIKPDNILIDTSKGIDIAIADFGNASVEGYCRSEKGNWLYRGPDPIKKFSQDIYSLGLVLLELFTGYRITRAGGINKTQGVYPDVHKVCLESSSQHKELLAKMVHSDPTVRPTAAELCQYFGVVGAAKVKKPRKKTYKEGRTRKLFDSIADKHKMGRRNIVYCAAASYVSNHKVGDKEDLYITAGAVIGCCLFTHCSTTTSLRTFYPHGVDVLHLEQAIKEMLDDHGFCGLLY